MCLVSTPIDWFEKSDIQIAIGRIAGLLECGIFHPDNARHVLLRAAFIELLIDLRDLMYKAEKHAERIAFVDDVRTTEKIQDVTGLIKFVRDALCHPELPHHYLEPGNIKATFGVHFGKGTLLEIGEFKQSSKYEDDICFFFGSQEIYLNRHIVRAFEEAKAKLLPLLSTDRR